MISEQQAQIALQASSDAYNSVPLGFGNYASAITITGEDGFQAVIYRNNNNPSDVVVAFTGTQDNVDGFADVNLGTTQ